MGIAYARPVLAWGVHRPWAPLPGISMADVWSGLYRAALPQLPVTLVRGRANPNPSPDPNPSPNPNPNPSPNPKPDPNPNPNPDPSPNPDQVTLLNAVVSTAKLTHDLYPERSASVRQLGLSIGL